MLRISASFFFIHGMLFIIGGIIEFQLFIIHGIDIDIGDDIIDGIDIQLGKFFDEKSSHDDDISLLKKLGGHIIGLNQDGIIDGIDHGIGMVFIHDGIGMVGIGGIVVGQQLLLNIIGLVMAHSIA